MFGLEYFSFRELWSPVFLLCTIAVAVAYLYITGPYRHRFKNAKPVKLSQKSIFLLGLFLYYFALGGPLNILAHLMFSAHMLAMAIAYLIVPPLVLLGLPAWLVRPLFEYRSMKIILKVMHPILTVLLFNVLFSFYHIPMIHDVVMTNYVLHTIFYVVMLIAAFMMWFPITYPVPELRRLSDLQRMAYVFANGVLLTPACALIIFAGAPMYATFNDPQTWMTAMGYCLPANTTLDLTNFVGGPEYFTLIPAIDDQQLGGVIMKLIQEIMYGGILAYIFYQWYRRENPDDQEDEKLEKGLEILGNADLKRA